MSDQIVVNSVIGFRIVSFPFKYCDLFDMRAYYDSNFLCLLCSSIDVISDDFTTANHLMSDFQ